MSETIAVVGATGAVGRIILKLLEERDFPAREFKFLASGRSAGTKIKFRGHEYTIEELVPDAFNGVDLAIGSTPDEVAKEFVPWAVERGCVVVDESGYWRMDPKVPLVIPEVNPDAALTHKGMIASPNCSTTQLGRRPQAAARCRPGEARRRQHLSGHQRRRPGRLSRFGKRHQSQTRRRQS